MTAISLDIATPEVFAPLLAPARYKGAHGGRGGGKSHFFAGLAVERAVAEPDFRIVCIREFQKSLQYSVKALIEAKIRALDVGDLFEITEKVIRRLGGDGLMIFEGMQDHTAESIKSLEAFDVAWVEEAQSLSAKSLQLLRPTIRKDGSELWFSWNPDQPTDPVDSLLRPEDPDRLPAGAVVVPVNYPENPFCPPIIRQEARDMLRTDPEAYQHVYGGGYNARSKAAVLGGKWVVDEFEPAADWDGPYHGADWGFAEDPTTLVRVWLHAGRLYVERESYQVGLELDDTGARWRRDIVGAERYVVRADSARPESISYVKRGGPLAVDPFPRLEAAPKWTGSVEDGIKFLRAFERIVIHPSCVWAKQEATLYAYKIDKRTGDVLPDIVDKHNHVWDAVRYALAPLIQARSPGRVRSL